MPSKHRLRRGLVAALCAAGLAVIVSCSPWSTEPVRAPVVHRTVTVVVTDSLGAAAPNAADFWISEFDSAGVAEMRFDETDAGGADMEVLAEGPWLVSTASAMPSRVAGGSFVVSGAGRALADTQVVRLVLHTGSRASGVARLAGRTEHSGSLVSAQTGGFAVTDSTGAWTMNGLPLGRWTLTMFHFGFKMGVAQAVVTVPGSAVTVPSVTMISDP